jgi:hypothetical protein
MPVIALGESANAFFQAAAPVTTRDMWGGATSAIPLARLQCLMAVRKQIAGKRQSGAKIAQVVAAASRTSWGAIRIPKHSDSR